MIQRYSVIDTNQSFTSKSSVRIEEDSEGAYIKVRDIIRFLLDTEVITMEEVNLVFELFKELGVTNIKNIKEMGR